tara:strand:+ start:210 stop:428 length:219 start_codon:yes stop_codon:yes gene_type:complete
MFKFEMQIGWLGNGKVTVETNDFDIIETLKDFIEFQESEGWVECYEFSTIDEDAEDELEDEPEETMSGQAVQ